MTPKPDEKPDEKPDGEEAKRKLEELKAKAAAEGKTLVPMPRLVQRLQPRQAAALCGTIAELVFWAMQARTISRKVAEAWALGQAHPLALLATTEVPRKILSVSGTPPPPVTRLAGAAMTTPILTGIETALEKLERGLDQADKVWKESPGEDVLEKRIRERIAGALEAFVRYVAALDPEQQAEISSALMLALAAFSEENGLKPAPEGSIFNWTSFWAPGAEPTEEPELALPIGGIASAVEASEARH